MTVNNSPSNGKYYKVTVQPIYCFGCYNHCPRARPAHVSVGAPAGAGWRVSESVPNHDDSKVIELNTRQETQATIVSKQFISSSLYHSDSSFHRTGVSCEPLVLDSE